MTYLADRTMNKRSSDRTPTLWSAFSDSLFGAPDTRTDFDRKVDLFVQKATQKTNKKSKKLRQTTIEQDQNFAVDLPMFLGEIRMGTTNTIINVVFDTGSDWLVVPDIDCVNCNSTVLVNSSKSGTPVD